MTVTPAAPTISMLTFGFLLATTSLGSVASYAWWMSGQASQLQRTSEAAKTLADAVVTQNSTIASHAASDAARFEAIQVGFEEIRDRLIRIEDKLPMKKATLIQ